MYLNKSFQKFNKSIPKLFVLRKNYHCSVEIFSDGSCLKNPGCGGWAALLKINRDGKLEEKILRGNEKQTTNNRMELTAALKALEFVNDFHPQIKTSIKTDSKYLTNGITKWISKWKVNGWKSSTGLVKNQELWMQLDTLLEGRTVDWIWVKAHAGHSENEIVDKIAKEEAKKAKPT